MPSVESVASSITAFGSTTNNQTHGNGNDRVNLVTAIKAQLGKVGRGAAMWVFEPHVAEQIFEEMVAEYEIPVYRDQWLDRGGEGVKLEAGRITRITMLSGESYEGKMFVDATYEGDLLAAAGVDFHVGREANSVYGENWNGIQVGVLHHSHWFAKPIDPYVQAG